MAFWDKLFKKQEEKNIFVQSTKDNVEMIDLSVGKDEAMGTICDNKEYSPCFSLLTEEEQKYVIEFIRPVTDKWQIMNLKLAYGVRMESENILMVSYRTVNERDKNSGKTIYHRHFVILMDTGCSEVYYTSENLHDEGSLIYSVPSELEEPLKQAMDFYRNWPAHKEYEKACKERGVDLMKLNNMLREPLFKEYEVYEEEQKKLKAEQKKSVSIESEADAKSLFFACQPYHKLKEEYTEETVKAFEKYATGDKKKEWVIEECKNVLSEIIQGNRENIYEKLEKINGRCSYFLGVASDVLAEDYTKACKALFDSDEKRFVVCIHTYLSYLLNSQNSAVAVELMDMTEKHYKENYPEEYEHGGIDTHPQKFKSVCCMLRGKIREQSEADKSKGFFFTLTSEETLRAIVISYRNKYNDDAAVKESIAELNCGYGVENDEWFLTARNSMADSYMLHNWDRLWFVALHKNTGEVMEFRCRREAEDGGLVADYYGGSSKEHWSVLAEAVEFYRNIPERKQFFEAYSKEHNGESIDELMKSSHKGLLAKFKRHYEKEYKRLNGNPLKDVLRKVVDLCEEKAPIYGYKNTKIDKPATEEEIQSWEQEHGMVLPENYKHFVRFANGIQFFGNSEYISGLQGLNPPDEYLGADYIHLGEMIGDGTIICMSKTSGKVYIADHGEYEDKGDFAEFLEYFLDFLHAV